MSLLLLLLAGCGGGGDDSTPVSPPGGTCLDTGGAPCNGATTTSVPSVTTPPPPTLASPAEATDLDADPGVLHVQLTAAPHSFPVGDTVIDGYAYNEQVPGPTLRARVGDTLVVELTNELDQPTTIHWHGLAVPWEMDGIIWMQDPIQPGATFTYSFVLEEAGTFWYHPHFDTEHQVDHGLYGMLVVEDPAEPEVDEALWVFDSWGEEAFGDAHTHAPDPTARTWTVNGLVQPEWQPPSGGTTRVRVLNAANAGYLWFEGVTVIGGDQGLLEAPETAVVLGPGDRAELEWVADQSTVLQTGVWSPAGGPAWGEPIDLLSVVPGPAGGSGAVSWPHGGAIPTPDPGTTDIVWALSGDGEADTWMINGEQFPNVTVPTTPLATGAVIEVRNLSAAEHPFHLHGMHFEVLSVDGNPPAVRTIEDTWNVRMGEIVRLRVEPQRAGDWMAHCHILPHAEQGMMTVLRVE